MKKGRIEINLVDDALADPPYTRLTQTLKSSP